MENNNKNDIKNNIKKTGSIICDFQNYNDFYFEKLNKNMIKTKKVKNGDNSYCLEVNLDCIASSELFEKLTKKRDLIVFDLDGVVFDVSESYITAIQETFRYFTGKTVSIQAIKDVKKMSGMNCDWDVVDYLLKREDINIEMQNIADVFQDFFYNPELYNKGKRDFLINREKLIIQENVFEALSQKFDLAVFSGRLKYEADYSLNRFGIDKYFYYFITSDNLKKEQLKPSPWGLKEIMKNCPYKTIKYIGDSIDDIKAGLSANVETIGVIYDKDSKKEKIYREFGAKQIITNVKEFSSILLQN